MLINFICAFDSLKINHCALNFVKFNVSTWRKNLSKNCEIWNLLIIFKINSIRLRNTWNRWSKILSSIRHYYDSLDIETLEIIDRNFQNRRYDKFFFFTFYLKRDEWNNYDNSMNFAKTFETFDRWNFKNFR